MQYINYRAPSAQRRCPVYVIFISSMKKLLFLLAILISSCTRAQTDSSATPTLPMTDITEQTDYGHQTERTIDIIVVHSNYYVGRDSFSTKGCIDQFRAYDVAPHYLIERDGHILKMVDEKDIAWHAGKSQLPGTERTYLNNTSIGIELINTMSQGPTQEQTESLLLLVNDIRSRRNIKYLMRHSDIAPDRKTDPWCFDWTSFCKRVRETSGEIITVEEETEEEMTEEEGEGLADESEEQKAGS